MAEKLHLDVDFETARSLHRVVRAMNDGECPKCHVLIEDYHMRKMAPALASPKYTETMQCPKCGFMITGEEAKAAIDAFAPVMDRCEAVSDVTDSDTVIDSSTAFADYLPLSPVRIAPGEYAIKDRSGRTLWTMDGAALADWVCQSVNGYDSAVTALAATQETE